MRKYNVLLATPLDRVAGAENSTLSLAKGLKERGHKVTVLLTNNPMLEEFKELDVRIVVGEINLRTPLGILKGSYEMKRCILQNNIDIIHLQNAFLVPMAFLARRSLKSVRSPIIWHCRGIKNISYFIVGRLFNYMVDFVIANCQSERNRLVSNHFKESKISTIYNCFNISPPNELGKNIELLSELGIQTNSEIIGTVSTLTKNKGINIFLEAIVEVSKEFPRTKFLIVGHGPLEDKLKLRTRELGIQDNVLFLGARRDIEKIYSIIDVLVVPSLWGEATNNTVAEAMVFAKPVISTDIGGLPELVEEGHNGILIPPGDLKKLSLAILRLLRNNKLAKEMGLKGREKVMVDFSLDRLINEVEEVYNYVDPYK